MPVPCSMTTSLVATPRLAVGFSAAATKGLFSNQELTSSTMAVDELVSPVERLMKDLYVVAAIGLAAPLNLPVFRAGLEAQLARHPYFRSIQVTGKDGAPRWVTTPVNLDDHIVVPRLAGDPDPAVEDYLASLSTLPMDHTRPPWEFHFLDVRTAEAAATVALRMHHALADGMALITLLISSARSAADPARPASAPPPPARRTGAIYAPPRAALLVRVWSYLLLAWHTLVDVAAFVATFLFLSDPNTLFKRSAADHGEPRRRMRFVHRSFSLDDVKFIKNAMNYVRKIVQLSQKFAQILHASLLILIFSTV